MLLVDPSLIVLIVLTALTNQKELDVIKKNVNIIKKNIVKNYINLLMFVMVVQKETNVH